MSGRLAGKVAVVTGGASGIGEATVRRFVGEGANVVIADLQQVPGQMLATELGAAARFINTNVMVEDNVAAAIDLAVLTWGRLDVMFNNAGIIGVTGPIATTDIDAYETTMAVLLRSVVFGMKHAATVMVPQQSGVILSTASVAAFVGGLGAHIYSAAKAAIVGLTQSVAAELWPHGIRVNALVPGKIATPMTASLTGLSADPSNPVDVSSAAERRADRRGLPEDIAAAAAFLASDDGAFITGESVRVDGGLTQAGGPSPFAIGKYDTPGMIPASAASR
jgi:NAD(P)-dependent dehydrogenase (short-subunit alcohol dehydrogenase family)